MNAFKIDYIDILYPNYVFIILYAKQNTKWFIMFYLYRLIYYQQNVNLYFLMSCDHPILVMWAPAVVSAHNMPACVIFMVFLIGLLIVLSIIPGVPTPYYNCSFFPHIQRRNRLGH